jgi:hypothetical protein
VCTALHIARTLLVNNAVAESTFVVIKASIIAHSSTQAQHTCINIYIYSNVSTSIAVTPTHKSGCKQCSVVQQQLQQQRLHSGVTVCYCLLLHQICTPNSSAIRYMSGTKKTFQCGTTSLEVLVLRLLTPVRAL